MVQYCITITQTILSFADELARHEEPGSRLVRGVKVKSLPLLVLLVMLMVQLGLPVVQAQTICTGTNVNFISLRSGYLCLNGSRIRFVGANVPNLMQAGYLPGSTSSPSGATRLSDAGHYGIDIVKVWIDNPCPTAYQLLQSNPTAFYASVDSMLADAKANNVLLNPSLVTTHNSGCWNQWVSVLGGDPFTNTNADTLLKTRWIQPIVSHYAANSQIAYWEIAAEPDCLGCGGSSDSLSSVISWANDMASYIRGIDSNHLLSADWGGFGQLKWTGTAWDYTLIDQKDQFMDFVSVHTYGGNGNLSPPTSTSPGSLGAIYQSGQSDGSLWGATDYYVNLYTAHAHSIGKAMEFSEYGQDVSSAGDTKGGWNQMILNATANRNADSSEVWTWETNGWGPWNVNPSQNPILVQAMSYWSTVMSLGTTQSGPDFNVSISSPASAPVGQSTNSTISVVAIGGFAGAVTLSDKVPNGLTCTSISPSSITGSGVAAVSCTSAAEGDYPLTISGTNGSLTRTAVATFSFQDFGISASSPAKISPGSSGSSIVSLTTLNGFTGTVTLKANVPAGLACSGLDPGSITSSGKATLSCTSNSQNIYKVTITGVSGSLARNTTASFTFGTVASPSGGGFCLSCISSTTLSNFDWLLIIGGLIGVTSSIALFNARASIELRRARARIEGLARGTAAELKIRELKARSS